MNKDDLMSPSEVALLIGQTIKTLANWRSTPTARPLAFRKFGGRVYYIRSEAEKWILDEPKLSTGRLIDKQLRNGAASRESIRNRIREIDVERASCWERIAELNAELDRLKG